MAGALTSLAIIVVCLAGLHTIVDLRRQQARRLGVPYMDKPRRLMVVAAAAVAVLYFGGVAIAVATGW